MDIVCANHGAVKADFYCRFCEVAFCSSCVRVKGMGHLGRTEINLCPLCDRPVVRLELMKEAPPFGKYLATLARSPFRSFGIFLFPIWIVVSNILRAIPWITSGGDKAYVIYYNIPIMGVSFILFLPIIYEIARVTGDGEFNEYMDEVRANLEKLFFGNAPPVFGQLKGLLWPMPAVLFAWILFAPIRPTPLSYFIWKSLTWMLLGIMVAALALLPMSVMMTSQIGYNARGMENFKYPLYLITKIKNIVREYLLLWTGIVATLLLFFGYRFLWMKYIFTGSIFSYFLYFSVDGFIILFLVVVFAQLLGYIVFKRRFDLKFTTATKKKPDIRLREISAEEIQKGPAPEEERDISELISDGKYLLDHGNYSEGLLQFHKALEKQPDNEEALRGSIIAALSLEDYETVRRCGKRLGALFARQNSFDVLWDAYRDYRKKVEDFIFEPPEMFGMAKWLQGGGDHLEAARVLRELAVKNPQGDHAPEALYECAQLLWKKCDKPENASSIFKVIIERYPESKQAEWAAKMLDEISPPS